MRSGGLCRPEARLLSGGSSKVRHRLRRVTLGNDHVRRVLRVGGLVAVGAGAHTAAAGGRSVPGFGARADARLESELRFYGVFYVAYGVELWRAAARIDRDPTRVRELAAVLFSAGIARAAGWRRAGRPSAPQLLLLAAELIAPPLLVAGQEQADG